MIKYSNKFDYVVRRGDVGDINNTNDPTTPNNGLVNGKGCLQRIWSNLKTDSYFERTRLELETYWVVQYRKIGKRARDNQKNRTVP